jgi:glycine/D-amino acid oxidase-like deaminating enzyme
MAPSPGLLVTMAPVSPTVRRVVHTGDVALRPDGSGRVLVASRAVDAGLDPATRTLDAFDPAVSETVRRALDWLPGLDLARPDRVRIGIRSVSTDGRPAVGPLDTAPGLYVLVSHSGATLAPILGELVAHELTVGPAAELEAYRPGRFEATT